MREDATSAPCECCGRRAPRVRFPHVRVLGQEWGLCDACSDAGCHSDGDGDMARGESCPLVAAGPDVVMCLHCAKPLHKSEPLTFIDNSNPGAGGCHARCVAAYHAWRERIWGEG